MTKKLSISPDEYFMRKAINLARDSIGKTWPNPCVGCIIVKEGDIISSARTADGGRPHAEMLAIESAGLGVAGSTMYVTLEPCCNNSITPPCVDKIIESKISKVVIATIDPNPAVNGKGVEMLKNAGIQVILNVCNKEAQYLIQGFQNRIIYKRPYVTLKLAMSIDGKIALSNGNSKWITNETSRKKAHELRAKNNAILVGINTIIKDDPMLNCRHESLNNPFLMRVVLDSELKIPINSNIIKTSDKYMTSIFKSHSTEVDKDIFPQEVKILSVPEGDSGLNIKEVLKELANIGINNILIEGGSKIATSFIKGSHVDKIVIFQSKKIIGNDGIPAIGDLYLNDLSSCPDIETEIFNE